MGNKRKTRIVQEGGITLMALIITIIVLIILAAITIGTAYTSGIIQMGTQGAKDYASSALKENEILNETTAYVEDVVKNIKRRLGDWEYFEEKDTVNGAKGNSNNPTIPAGFRPINTNGANWGDGEQAPSKEAVNNGLVIEDRDGNQFVWVPCYVDASQQIVGTNYPKYEQYTYTGGQDTDAGATQVDNNGWKTWDYRQYKDWEDTEAKGYGEASVKQYGGFWIGRYEAGIPENASFYPEADDAQYTKDTERNVTKSTGKGNHMDTTGAYNGRYAEHVYSAHTGAGTEDGLIVATKYQNGVTKYGQASKTLSQLQNGLFEANATLIDENHRFTRRIETPTGANDNFAVKNIYDMGGNMYEWTTETGKHETSGQMFTVRRGGGFTVACTSNPTCFRNGGSTQDTTSLSTGFRIVLYVK